MNDGIRIAAAGITAAICAMAIRRQVPELAVVIGICGAAMILLYASGSLEAVMDFADELTEAGGLSPEVIRPVLKVVGISVVTRLSADFCRDAQSGSLGAAVELAGSCAALAAMLPLFSAVLEMMTGLL